MSSYTYTMIFALPQDKEDFILSLKGQRRYKIVADIDRRTILIQFRKGTKAERMFAIADIWGADILWGEMTAYNKLNA